MSTLLDDLWTFEADEFASFWSAAEGLTPVVLSLLALFVRERATGTTAGLMRDLLDEPAAVIEGVEGVLQSAVLSCSCSDVTIASVTVSTVPALKFDCKILLF